ncbi:Insulin-like growth factor-binding protein-related protein 1 [Blattella germanica]|nr:Insulin-like growth factor-binding protein-related protein 1 [Blattella germanica]
MCCSRFFLVFFAFAVAGVFAVRVDRGGEFPHKDCPKCNEELCPKAGTDCPQGIVPDICGCCSQGVCGLSEGENCFNATLGDVLPPESRKYGLCGANLHCLLREDLTPRDEPEALCYCKETQQACASDNRTALGDVWPRGRGALFASEPGLGLRGEGLPDPRGALGVQSRRQQHQHQGDDQYVAVQVRGGPEPFMVTTWVQIVALRPSDIGTYYCVATNSEGEARAAASVGVRK